MRLALLLLAGPALAHADARRTRDVDVARAALRNVIDPMLARDVPLAGLSTLVPAPASTRPPFATRPPPDDLVLQKITQDYNPQGEWIGHVGPFVPSVARVVPVGLERDEVDRVVRSRLGIFRACYQVVLNHDDTLAGRLDLAFDIDAKGDVAGAVIKSSTLGAPAVETCILRQVQRLKFPAGGALTHVRYPLLFSVR